MTRERIEKQELEKELAEAEIWGTSHTGALLRKDAAERRQRRLRLGPFGETRRLKAYASPRLVDRQSSDQPDPRDGLPTDDGHMQNWTSNADDSATETTMTSDASSVDTDTFSDDSSSCESSRLTHTEDGGLSSERSAHSARADWHWQNTQPDTFNYRPAVGESRATLFSEQVDFGIHEHGQVHTPDEQDGDSLDSTLVPQRDDSDAQVVPPSYREGSEIQDGKTEAWGTLNEILVNKIVELAHLNAEAAAATKGTDDRVTLESEAARVALATAMDLQATAARVSVAADKSQITSPLRRGHGRYSSSPTATRPKSHSQSHRHRRRHRSRSRGRSRRHRSTRRRDDETSYSDDDDTSISSRPPRRSSHRRHRSSRSHRPEQDERSGRSARSYSKSSQQRSRRHHHHHHHHHKGTGAGEDGEGDEGDPEVQQDVLQEHPVGQGATLAHMALLGSLEAGEQQLKLRQTALANALEVAQAAEAKHAAEARRLREHYGYPGDGEKDAPDWPELHHSEHTSHSELAAPNEDVGRAGKRQAELPTVPRQSPMPQAAKASATFDQHPNLGSKEDAETEDAEASEMLLLRIDAVAPIGRWPDWAVSMLRARQFSSHQEVPTASQVLCLDRRSKSCFFWH